MATCIYVLRYPVLDVMLYDETSRFAVLARDIDRMERKLSLTGGESGWSEPRSRTRPPRQSNLKHQLEFVLGASVIDVSYRE